MRTAEEKFAELEEKIRAMPAMTPEERFEQAVSLAFGFAWRSDDDDIAIARKRRIVRDACFVKWPDGRIPDKDVTP